MGKNEEKPAEHEYRQAVDLEAFVTVDDEGRQATRITGLSHQGCCISGFHIIGNLVELAIVSLGVFKAQVLWASGGQTGLRFIHQDLVQLPTEDC